MMEKKLLHPAIISITGTKGKTTITRAIAHVLHKAGENVLRVDTDGHYINEVQKSSLDDSKMLFSLVPTVCPGKYLITMQRYYPNFVAVLETALGSSGAPGLGYGLHQIGIFTNVLEDHMGASARLKNRMDLARAKQFIFSRIDVKGTILFNADDQYVCSQLRHIPAFRKVNLLPVGINFKYFDKTKHLSGGGEIISFENGYIILEAKRNKRKIINTRKISWTFGGLFLPSIYNLMFITGGIYTYYGKKLNRKLFSLITNYKLERFGGRLTLLGNTKGIKILVDYAHEKYSLAEVAKLGHQLKQNKKNKLIGVVRLAPDRPNNFIVDTGKFIANSYDDIIVYDKIDGVTKKKYVGRKSNIVRLPGEVSSIFYKGISSTKNKGNIERIIIEEKAIKRASGIAKSGDVVVVICGDDHKRTIGYVKKYFRANFVSV